MLAARSDAEEGIRMPRQDRVRYPRTANIGPRMKSVPDSGTANSARLVNGPRRKHLAGLVRLLPYVQTIRK